MLGDGRFVVLVDCFSLAAVLLLSERGSGACMQLYLNLIPSHKKQNSGCFKGPNKTGVCLIFMSGNSPLTKRL